MSADLAMGLAIGFIAAGILGFVLGRVRLYRTKMLAANKPMTVKTEKSPRQAMADSSRAGCLMMLWLLILVGAVAGGLYLLAQNVM